MSLTNAFLPELVVERGSWGDEAVGDGDVVSQLAALWLRLRAPVVAPLLQAAVYLCLLMVFMLFLERVYMAVVLLLVKVLALFRRLRVPKLEPVEGDIEMGSHVQGDCPVVLVQIPMYNEKEVYQLSIQAACGLVWPADRIIIQVLDDSTDPQIKAMVEMECQRWRSKGINIKYETRENRKGYKAGALRAGMEKEYVRTCEFVAIFDADFQPQPEFLQLTLPHLRKDPQLALVQARWAFVNNNECLLTKMQDMSLGYHFSVEQPVGSGCHSFFGFNGTAGVWRISAISEAGGWNDRTTVEDMDLAVRASLKGWKFLFRGDIKVKSELPSTFKAYRYQQHRWSCGPASLFRRILPQILKNKRVSLYTKWHIIYSFFVVRKLVAHLVTFFFFSLIIPATVLVPEVRLPVWGTIYAPSVITFLNAAVSFRSLHLLVFWILFENVMSLHRSKATIIGLFDLGRVNEWIVTEKLGDVMKLKSVALKLGKRRMKFGERLHALELFTAFYLFFCASYDLAFGRNYFWIYLYSQSVAYFICGFGYVGTIVPS